MSWENTILLDSRPVIVWCVSLPGHCQGAEHPSSCSSSDLIEYLIAVANSLYNTYSSKMQHIHKKFSCNIDPNTVKTHFYCTISTFDLLILLP